MSGLDQPLLIANSNYHVGHQTSIRIAEERGYFRDEGFTNYVYEWRGLVPGPLEPLAIGRVVQEHGIDIATAVDVGSVLQQRARGADLYIVGGWRYPPNLKFFGSKHIADLRDLRGKRIGTREAGGLDQLFIGNNLRKAGIDPRTDVEWIYDPVFAYGNDPAHLDMLRSGRVDGMSSQPPFTEQLRQEGFPLLLDPFVIYPGGRPDKVIAATGRVLGERPDELRAFLRANIRAFWAMRDVANFAYLQDLETRYRAASHNDEERRLRIVTSIEKLEGWNVPIDGGVSRAALEQVIEELRTLGELDDPPHIDDVLRDDLVREAYREVSSRPELQPALSVALAARAKYGF
jgi:ABC-type nitrate/sulfonate/bicarbonate transport system substrate-binding protein